MPTPAPTRASTGAPGAPAVPIPILLYHSIAPRASADYARWCVHPDRFAEHLDAVLALGFTPMTISELVDASASASLPDRPLAITFDDGRADFAEHAVPVLASRGVAATLYVVTGLVGETSRWLPIPAELDAPMMTWDDVRTADAAGVEIGSHSATHVELDVVAARQLDAEIAGSRAVLAAQLGHPVRSMAYPHGYHSRAVVRAVRAAGFDSACAVKDGWSSSHDDRFALSRLFVWGSTTPDELRTMLATPGRRPHPAQAVLRVGWRWTRRARHRAAGRRTMRQRGGERTEVAAR